jgi:hypothetical protein
MTALVEKAPLPDFVHGELETVPDESFQIRNEGQAAWAAGRVLSARRRIVSRGRLAEAYQTRILDWLANANREDERSVGFLEQALRPWVESEVANLGKTRSLKILGARVGLRKRPDKVDLFDTDAALEFCIEHLAEAVQVKKELSRTELKRALVEGARIPGAILVTGQDELVLAEE